MRLILLQAFLTTAMLMAQRKPDIPKIPQPTKYTYVNTITLPNGEKVKKYKTKKPKKCKDCMFSVIYKDSIGQEVARISQGFARRIYVKEGYEEEWFNKAP